METFRKNSYFSCQKLYYISTIYHLLNKENVEKSPEISIVM